MAKGQGVDGSSSDRRNRRRRVSRRVSTLLTLRRLCMHSGGDTTVPCEGRLIDLVDEAWARETLPVEGAARWEFGVPPGRARLTRPDAPRQTSRCRPTQAWHPRASPPHVRAQASRSAGEGLARVARAPRTTCLSTNVTLGSPLRARPAVNRNRGEAPGTGDLERAGACSAPSSHIGIAHVRNMVPPAAPPLTRPPGRSIAGPAAPLVSGLDLPPRCQSALATPPRAVLRPRATLAPRLVVVAACSRAPARRVGRSAHLSCCRRCPACQSRGRALQAPRPPPRRAATSLPPDSRARRPPWRLCAWTRPEIIRPSARR